MYQVINQNGAGRLDLVRDAAQPFTIALVDYKGRVIRVISRHDNEAYAKRKAAELNRGVGRTTAGVR